MFYQCYQCVHLCCKAWAHRLRINLLKHLAILWDLSIEILLNRHNHFFSKCSNGFDGLGFVTSIACEQLGWTTWKWIAYLHSRYQLVGRRHVNAESPFLQASLLDKTNFSYKSPSILQYKTRGRATDESLHQMDLVAANPIQDSDAKFKWKPPIFPNLNSQNHFYLFFSLFLFLDIKIIIFIFCIQFFLHFTTLNAYCLKFQIQAPCII